MKEVKIDAELVFQFEEGDSSVGIPSGWFLVGLEVGNKHLAIDKIAWMGVKNDRLQSILAFDDQATRLLEQMPESFDR